MKVKILAILAFAAILSCTNTNEESDSTETAAVSVEEAGASAEGPEITFKKIDGEAVNISSLKGKVVLINFWATWCPPCIKEMPSLQALYNNYQSNPNVEFLVVEVDNKPDLAKKFVEDNKFTFPIYSPASSIPSTYLGQAIPTTLVLDKTGAIAYRHEGMSDFMDTNFVNLFEGILNK